MADDFSNTTSTTGTISVGGIASGNIETVTDTDWFKITLTVGRTYQFDLKGNSSGNGTLADPFLRLRDSSGNTIANAFADDGGTGLDSRFTYTPPSTGTYILSAGSSTASGTGTYKVFASDVTPVALTPSLSSVTPTSYTADANNHTMQIFGSNFQSGDTLTFTPPEGGSIASNPAKLTFVNSGEIDYQFNDASDAGTWSVKVNSPDNTLHSGTLSFIVPAPALTPSLSSVTPTSYTVDANNHTMQIFGSNFQSGDTLTFTPPEGGSIASNPAKLTFVNSGEIDYQFNDASDAGSWSVKVNSPDNTLHSGTLSFIVPAPSLTDTVPDTPATANSFLTVCTENLIRVDSVMESPKLAE